MIRTGVINENIFVIARPFFENMRLRESLYKASRPQFLSDSNAFLTVDKESHADSKATIKTKIKQLEPEL